MRNKRNRKEGVDPRTGVVKLRFPAEQCRKCRCNLSHGVCPNRMCALYNLPDVRK